MIVANNQYFKSAELLHMDILSLKGVILLKVFQFFCLLIQYASVAFCIMAEK